MHSTVGGKIAQLGQRLIDGAAKSLADDFFKRFDNELQRLYPPAEAAAGTIAPAAAEATGTQGGGIPGWAWAAGAVVLAALAWMALR